MVASKRIELTQERLKELFYYDEKNGNLINRVSKSGRGRGVGGVAGHLDKRTGYVRVKVEGRIYKTHRLIWIYVYGLDPFGYDIDHKNQIRNDNRIENLRLVNRSENLKNARKSKWNTSGFTGVHWDKRANKWKAQIRINGKPKHLGVFVDLNDAISCRKLANLKYNYHKNHGK